LDHSEFFLLIVLTVKILETIHGVSKLLQNKKCDLSKAVDIIQTANDSFHELRDKVDELAKQQLTLSKCGNITGIPGSQCFPAASKVL